MRKKPTKKSTRRGCGDLCAVLSLYDAQCAATRRNPSFLPLPASPCPSIAEWLEQSGVSPDDFSEREWTHALKTRGMSENAVQDFLSSLVEWGGILDEQDF